MLKIGLVGVGGISGAHIPAWNAMEDHTHSNLRYPSGADGALSGAASLHLHR